MAVASILVSEAERDVRRLFEVVIGRLGHEAIVLGADVVVPPRADILLVDPISPLSIEHVRLVRAFFPELPLICLNLLPESLGFIGRGPLFFLPKPFAPDRLAEAIDRALASVLSPV